MEPAQASRLVAIACTEGCPLAERVTAAVLVVRWEGRWREPPPARTPWPDDLIEPILARLDDKERPRLWERIMAGRQPPEEAWEAWDIEKEEPIPGRHCAVCDGAVYSSPGGPVCRKGHGGADEADEVEEEEDTPPNVVPFPGGLSPLGWEPKQDAKAAKTLDPDEYDFSEVSVLLSDEQRRGLTVLLKAIDARKREVRLAGIAGSGKTHLMRALLEMTSRNLYLLAPTNQARKRLAEVTKAETSTLHSFIYPRPEETPTGELIFPDPRLKEEVDPAGVFVVDEASMVGRKVADHFRGVARGGTIVWVGDPEQLPAVGEPPGVDLQRAEVKLTEVHRQALGSPPLALATEVRLQSFPPKNYLRQLALKHGIRWLGGGPETVSSRLFAEHRAGRDAVALAWTNDDRRAINRAYRAGAGATDPLHPLERIVICSNHYHLGLLNGDVLFVESVAWEPAPPWLTGCIGNVIGTVKIIGRQQPIYVTDTLLCADRKMWASATAVARAAADQVYVEGSDNHIHMARAIGAIVHADYAYCMTTHRFQGSQADSVYLAWSQDWTWNPKWRGDAQRAEERFHDTRRWLYTSLTRTKTDLTIISLERDR